jgi:acetyl-CoA synthetase
VIGGERCPIVDTWWLTETGAIMITTLPGIQDTKPGSAGKPLPGIEAAVLDQKGNDAGTERGFLVLRKPWPSMLRTLYKEEDRFVETYWSKYGRDVYFVGDAPRRDEDGYFWIIGRVDDINVSGHRLCTAEVESAIVSHERVAEAAVIGQHDEDTGQAITAFVTLAGTDDGDEEAQDTLGQDHAPPAVRHRRGPRAGDVTTLRDPDVMSQLEGKIKERQDEE